ncbi:hypothetical protein EI42_00997 [Thermosporothrix hazakensis]|jgi:hypothetical protein|uniref:Uncharacterized protein n=2 Tax=Thermosporothrix TaxID=768650 RepID=A0A326UGB8_THEHA|nr:hypothetical protein [Thermosporothrix hazakensis]PZW36811.1 hypothetical protein EI42_00997 [Thermosporothrix hazakensis]BBH89277.1 hypothetical protein KTC_40280 [Thermosporothrix sp. COM3]GCE47460.1 hypothetical protein KTH_23290 [Thermosporothrix hazakensis]
MVLPFTDQQCFFVAILAFIVIGFIRGWKRELISLVAVLLAVFLIRPDSGRGFSQFISRLPQIFSFLITGSQANAPQPDASTSNFLGGPWGSIVLFMAIVLLGYFLGNKAFPKPGVPQERFLGVIPGIISGAFVMAYLSSMIPKSPSGQSLLSVAVQAPDPANYIPVLFLIAIVAVIIALVAARAKQAKK